MRLYRTNELQEGMILARDVYSLDVLNSLLLLPKDTVLTTKIIYRMIDNGIKRVFIRDGRYEDCETIQLLTKEEREQAVSEIRKVYEKNNINATSIGLEDMRVLEDITTMLVHKITTTPTLKTSMSDLRSYDEYTYHHCLSVACLSIAIGTALNLDEEKLQKLGLSALLHDIGKTMVGIDIINKPTRLTTEEFELVKMHPTLGGDYLRKHQLCNMDVYNGVLTHHEKFDGTGYPLKLKGENIPLFGRIISVADVYDALTSNRSYRKSLLTHEAFEYILGGVGTLFDETIVKAFTRAVAPYPIGTLVSLSNGQTGLVVGINEDFPLRPEIINLETNEQIDLSGHDINITIIDDIAHIENQ